MSPTYGIHAPDEPYVPSSDKCWGAKGHWHMKKPVDVMFENQAKTTPCSIPENGNICGNEKNWEVRLKEEHSQFVPNAKNFAPRPKNWKVNRNKNYYGTNWWWIFDRWWWWWWCVFVPTLGRHRFLTKMVRDGKLAYACLFILLHVHTTMSIY